MTDTNKFNKLDVFKEKPAPPDTYWIEKDGEKVLFIPSEFTL